MSTIAVTLGVIIALVLTVLALIGWRNNVMFKLGLRPILRRRTQSSLIVVGLMLATLIITAAFVTGDTLSHTIRSIFIEELGPIDELVLARTSGSSGQDGYFSYSWYEDFAWQLREYDRIDLVVPAIRDSLPAVDLSRRQSMRSLNIFGLQPADADRVLLPDERQDEDGNPLSLQALEGRQLYLNKAAADRLNAAAGDQIELQASSSARVFEVAGVTAGGRSPRAILDLHQAQMLLGQRGQINVVAISNLGDPLEGVELTQQVTTHLRTLLADEIAVKRLFSLLTIDSSAATAIQEVAPSYQGNMQADLQALANGLQTASFDQRIVSLLADEEIGSELASILEQAEWQTESMRARLDSRMEDLSDFTVEDTKRDGLNEADLAANAFTTIFVVTGLFGIASGLLLIFLIFVMLAAERKSEMGMARAIGAQRHHLIQMFIYEGTAYDLVAAAVGVVLGVATGLLIALTLGQAFASTDLVIRPNVTFKSLAVSYSLGMLVTFATVLVSARRVSRLNIVAAIRDLPEQPAKPVPLKDRLLTPVRTFLDGLKALFRLKFWRALRTWLLKVPSTLMGLIWMGFREGPFTFLLGLIMTGGGINASSGALFTAGVSFALIGAGVGLRNFFSFIWKKRRDTVERVAFTSIGLALTIFWSLPTDTFASIGVGDLKTGPEMLFIAGFMMVVGAVMVLMYNTDLLLRAILRVFGGNKRLAPVLRMAVAYPLANRFRTGLTLGMFGVVVFSVVFMATAFRANRAFFENTESLTGGYQLRAQVSPNKPIEDFARSAGRQPELRDRPYEVIASEYSLSVELQQEGQDWDQYRVRAVDNAYLESVGYEFAVMAEGYQSAQEIWQALATRPGYAIIDSYPVPSRQNTSIVVGGPEFQLEGIYLEDESMDPIRLRVRTPSGESFEVTVIGVLEQTSMLNFSLITSQVTLERALSNPPVPTQYYISLADGIEPATVGAALESAFLDYGLETVDQIQEIKDAQASQRAIEQLLLGFLTLGLIVGVAALGVISSRAVVERRQQIGVLRALGFQAKMVSWSFMLEASFIALLGITLGAGLALIPASQMINDLAADVPGLRFEVPWLSILLLIVLTYGMTLLATYLPAQQASRVSPAEALRYE